MPRQETDSYHLAQLSRLLNSEAIGLLIDIEVPSDPPTAFRITSFDFRVQDGEDDAGLPIYYYPWPVEIGPMENSGDGSLPTMRMSMAQAAGREISDQVDLYGGLELEKVKLRLVAEDAIGSGGVALEDFFKITQVEVTSKQVNLTLAAAPVYNDPMPRFRYSRVRCRKTFGSQECGYAIGVAGATLDDCPGYTLEACEQVGAEEEARGITGLHPRNFGGQRGIPGKRRS